MTLAAGQAATSVDFGNQINVGVLRGTKWEDVNSNGIREAGELPLKGKTIYLDLNNNSVRDTGEPTTTTGNDGSYEFVNLAPGSYAVRQELAPPFLQTVPAFTTDRLFLLNAFDVPDRIYELNPLTGAVIRSFAAPINGSIFNGLAFDGKTIFFLSESNDTLYELDPATGAVIDFTTLPANTYEGLAAVGGLVYVGHYLRWEYDGVQPGHEHHRQDDYADRLPNSVYL